MDFLLNTLQFFWFARVLKLREVNVVAVPWAVFLTFRSKEQSFDNFIAADRERLHSYANYFSQYGDASPADAQELLGLFDDVKAFYAVARLDEGWLTTSAGYDYQYISNQILETYRAFEGSGVRSTAGIAFSATEISCNVNPNVIYCWWGGMFDGSEGKTNRAIAIKT